MQGCWGKGLTPNYPSKGALFKDKACRQGKRLAWLDPEVREGLGEMEHHARDTWSIWKGKKTLNLSCRCKENDSACSLQSLSRALCSDLHSGACQFLTNSMWGLIQRERERERRETERERQEILKEKERDRREREKERKGRGGWKGELKGLWFSNESFTSINSFLKCCLAKTNNNGVWEIQTWRTLNWKCFQTDPKVNMCVCVCVFLYIVPWTIHFVLSYYA